MKARIDKDRESRDIEMEKEYSESLSNIAET